MTESAAPVSEVTPKAKFTGKVVRVELFGAFVDIGLKQPALLHISQLTHEGVTRAQDVLKVGEEVTVWVRRIDPATNRVDLTMKEPLGVEWSDLKPGMDITGKVVRIEKFGAFVELGAERPGLLHVSEMAVDYVADPRDKVNVGDEIKVRILNVDRKKKKIDLSLKVYEEEARAAEKAETAAAMANPGAENNNEEEEFEMISPIALAMQAALKNEGISTRRSRDNKRRDKRRRDLEEQDDLIERTLNYRR